MKAGAVLWVLLAIKGEGGATTDGRLDETSGGLLAAPRGTGFAEEVSAGEVDSDAEGEPLVGVLSGEDEALEAVLEDVGAMPLSSSRGRHWSELMPLMGGLCVSAHERRA